jgi:hypothetical protein
VVEEMVATLERVGIVIPPCRDAAPGHDAEDDDEEEDEEDDGQITWEVRRPYLWHCGVTHPRDGRTCIAPAKS